MLHQVGVSFDLYYDARKHKIKIRVCNRLSDTFAFGKVMKGGDGLLHLLSTLALECAMMYI